MAQLTEAQKKLVAKLQKGDRKKICDALGLSSYWVYRVLIGEYNNDLVWEKCAEIAAERDKTTKKIIQTAESLSNL